MSPVLRKSGGLAATASFLTGALVLCSCSSSGGTSSNGSHSGSKSPVTVEMISQITASNFQSPETVPAAKAVAAAINADGGLGGHPINLVTCDDKNDPTTAGNCARLAAQDGAVAVVEGVSEQGNVLDPILQAEKIPFIMSPNAPDDSSSSYSFPTDGGILALWGGEGQLLAESGCKKVAALYDSSTPSGTLGANYIKTGAETGGAQFAAAIGVSETSPDLRAAITTGEDDGADCFGTAMTETQSVAAIQALSQSAHPDLTFGDTVDGLSLAESTQLGAIAKHVILDNASYVAGTPQAAAFTAMMKKAGAAPTSFAEQVYIGFYVLQQALKDKTGTAVTAATVKAALDDSSDLSIPTKATSLSFNSPLPYTDYSRLMNDVELGYGFNGVNAYVALPGKLGSFDTKNVIVATAKGSS
jgi:branched-chain amino acid transport system substrate-binding protein